MKNLFIYFGITALVIFLSLIVYFKQAEFISHYDASYWKDRFDHSQWALPLSRRDIGDDGIYAYSGYRLMHGASIEETNSNKPPVGLYLIGISISLFDNPNIIILLTGIASLVVFYLLIKDFIHDASLSILTVAALAVNPMFFSHLWLPLIDLIQTFFLLCNVLALTYYLKSKRLSFLSIILAGIFLGLFTETKPPVLVPLILLLEGGYLLYQRKLKAIIIAGIGFVAAVLIPYFRYFQLGHGLLDYLRLHKYMASIYYQGKNEVHRFALTQAILFGRFPDISSGVSVQYPEWWIMLPVIWIGGLIGVIEKLIVKKGNVILKGLGIFVLLTFILFSNVSSYPRYLLVILPFVTLFFTLLLLRLLNPFWTKILLSLVVLVGLVHMYLFLQPKPYDVLNRFYYNISDNLFQDVYQEDIVNPKDTHMSQESFRKLLLNAFHQAHITNVDFKEKSRSFTGDTGKVIVDVTYFTQDIGTFSEEKTIYLKKVNENWEIVWNWNYVMNKYRPGFTFSTKVLPGKRGTIYDSQHDILAQDTQGYLISIDPSKIDRTREDEMLAAIAKATKISRAAIHNNYTENPISGIIYPIGTNFYQWSDQQIKYLQSFPGVIMSPHTARVYRSLDNSMIIGNTAYYECCTRIYSPYSYHGVSGVELTKDELLLGHNGGTLVMKNTNGEIVRTLINSSAMDGRNITVK